MTFTELCEDFAVNKPDGEPIEEKTIVLLSDKWESGSVNDKVGKYCRNNGLSYIYNLGKMWILYHGEWCDFRYEYDRDILIVYLQFYQIKLNQCKRRIIKYLNRYCYAGEVVKIADKLFSFENIENMEILAKYDNSHPEGFKYYTLHQPALRIHYRWLENGEYTDWNSFIVED